MQGMRAMVQCVMGRHGAYACAQLLHPVTNGMLYDQPLRTGMRTTVTP